MAVTVPDGTYPYEHNLSIRRGDTFSEVFTFTSRDFTDCTFKCQVRDMYDKKLILAITPILSGTNVVTFSKSATQTNVPAGRYPYDMAVTSEDGTDVDYLKGVFTIQDDVSSNVANPLEDDDEEPIIVG